jgi:hypothetical protein
VDAVLDRLARAEGDRLIGRQGARCGSADLISRDLTSCHTPIKAAGCHTPVKADSALDRLARVEGDARARAAEVLISSRDLTSCHTRQFFFEG